MLNFKIVRNKTGDIIRVKTSLSGRNLLSNPQLNKGCAFTQKEREIFDLIGLLPHHVETLEQQVIRMHAQYHEQQTNMGKNIYLNVLHDYNETLFYKLINEHLEEMLPVIYTPTIGEAVERFSLEHRKPRGHYISYPERNHIEKILDNRLSPEIDLIVVTDGEAILGIGDQGIGGINISSAKLMVYSLCGGINPNRVLPIQLDVGTNNQALLADPMYLGWRHERISGQAYDDFIDAFVYAVIKKNPHIFLHWEDIGRENASRILTRFRPKICTFNDDMQGTGVVTLSCILSAGTVTNTPLSEQRIVIFGSGTAGIGIANHICDGMQREGIAHTLARQQFWLLDKQGLLTETSDSLQSFQKTYARTLSELTHWTLRDPHSIQLYDVIKNVKPTILIGCSAVAGAFTEEIITLMANQVERPLIMPLSNPTYKAEAKPEDVLAWTRGKAMIATGSPFPDVNFNDQLIRIAQSNNAFAFPGIGLGAIAVKAKHLTDDMLWAATNALSQHSPIMQDKNAALLPKISHAKSISYQVALAVARQAQAEGIARKRKLDDLPHAIKRIMWEPNYYPYRKI